MYVLYVSMYLKQKGLYRKGINFLREPIFANKYFGHFARTNFDISNNSLEFIFAKDIIKYIFSR